MHTASDALFKTLADPTRRAIFERLCRDWMSLYGAFWRDRFDRLEALLKRMDQ